MLTEDDSALKIVSQIAFRGLVAYTPVAYIKKESVSGLKMFEYFNDNGLSMKRRTGSGECEWGIGTGNGNKNIVLVGKVFLFSQ